MLELFSPVKSLLKPDPVSTSNFAFRLHTRATVLLLLVCTILVTAKQYFGDPITCITDTSIDKESVNAYCWIYGTFTVSRHLHGVPGRSVVSAGVGGATDTDQKYHHHYYQWVCFVLALQAILFYVPKRLWCAWENGTIAFLSRDLSASPFLLSPRDTWTTERKRCLVDYFSARNLHLRDFYAFRFSVCELLNFLNTLAQIYALDAFLEGQFRGYGSAVLAFTLETQPFARKDPMARLFPKMSKCTIHTFGASGSAQVHDALCVLPLNVVHEKVFVFLWFWFLFLAVVGSLALIYRMYVFTRRSARTYLLRATCRPALTPAKAKRLVEALSYGDWFLLYRLGHNVNPIIYNELLEELAAAFAAKDVLATNA